MLIVNNIDVIYLNVPPKILHIRILFDIIL